MKESPEILARVTENVEIMQNSRFSEHRARDSSGKPAAIARTCSEWPGPPVPAFRCISGNCFGQRIQMSKQRARPKKHIDKSAAADTVSLSL